MESTRGKHYNSYKSAKSTFPYQRHHYHHHENNHYSVQPGYGIYKFQRRKEHYNGENYRSRHPYKIIDINNKKSNKTVEEEEEEERKKKLKETSKQLLNKIKAWNAERNCSENNSEQNFNNNQVDTESSCKNNKEKVNSENNAKREAHSKKTMIVKSRSPKTFSQPVKSVTRHDINKETIKDFQNRIHRKLIEELLQMPKENLRNILNNPKINHIMDLRISRLVRESNSLMSQKFSELKIKNSLNISSNSELLIDIDELIGPVIETDLSALPPELIKQLENIYQIQFDYSQNEMNSQVKSDVCDNTDTVDDIAMDANSGEEVVNKENNGVSSVYECLTDEDEEINSIKSHKSIQKNDSSLCEVLTKRTDESVLLDEALIKKENESCELEEILKKEPEESYLVDGGAIEEADEASIKKENESCVLDEILKKEPEESCLVDGGVIEEADEASLLNKVLLKKENESYMLDEVLTNRIDWTSLVGEVLIKKEESCVLDEVSTKGAESDKMELEDEQQISLKGPESLQGNCLSSKNFISIESTAENSVQNISNSVREFISTSGQTDYEDALPQTQTNSLVEETVEEATNKSIQSLLKEVNSIQNLINKLNERRLMIFLQLARMNPSGSFLSDEITKKNFIESISNGNLNLVESLKQFFSTHLHEVCKSSEGS